MIRTFLYTLSISLLALAVQAQVKPDSAIKPAPGDTTRKVALQDAPRKKMNKLQEGPPKLPDSIYISDGGVRIGLDISRFPIHYLQPYRTDITVQADVRLNGKMYGAFETGFNRTSHSDANYTYKGNGVYATIGVDYDFLKKKEVGERNMIYGGIRYGFAQNSYEAPAFNITDDYWGSDIPGSRGKTSMTAHWIELVLGMKIEVLNNFFLGWGIREKIMVKNGAPDTFKPIVIPGFGSGTKNSQFDMTYTVSYYLPLYKVKVHVKRVPVKKK